MIIDAHSHLCSTDLERYPLANPASSYRPTAEGSAEVLRARLQEAGVDRAFTITPLRQPRMTCTQAVELFAAAIPLSREEREWILGGTAQRLWKWTQ